MRNNILIIDDQKLFRMHLRSVLGNMKTEQELQFNIHEASNLQEAYDVMEKVTNINIVLLDKDLNGENGFKEISSILGIHPESKIIAITGSKDPNNQAFALRSGAYNFITKEQPEIVLKQLIFNAYQVSIDEKENLTLQSIGRSETFNVNNLNSTEIPGKSVVINALNRKLRYIARNKETVLLVGESGSGKSVGARIIHNISKKILKDNSPRDFHQTDVGQIPETLIESELFGHVKGSFTGAIRDYQGIVRKADKGTLFLDEIHNLPLQAQAKLLTLVKDKKVTPVGSNRSVSVDIRLICATNKNLQEYVEKGLFLEDLYYRICPIEVEIPSLKDRIEDIPDLMKAIFPRVKERHTSYEADFNEVPNDFIQWNMNDLPRNNLRGLENRISNFLTYAYDEKTQRKDFKNWKKRMFSFSRSARKSIFHTSKMINNKDLSLDEIMTRKFNFEDLKSLKEIIDTIEKKVIFDALTTAKEKNLRKTDVAHKLGLSLPSLSNRLKKYNSEKLQCLQ